MDLVEVLSEKGGIIIYETFVDLTLNSSNQSHLCYLQIGCKANFFVTS